MPTIKEGMEKEDEEYKRVCAEWQPCYDGAIEYPASQDICGLESGRYKQVADRFPRTGREEAMKSLEFEAYPIGHLPLIEIASSFWTLQGTHFEASAAQNNQGALLSHSSANR